MTAVPVRLALFAALLAAVFGAAALAGAAIDPDADDASAGRSSVSGHAGTGGHGDHVRSPGSGHEETDVVARGAGALPGLAVAEGGLRLVLDRAAVAGPGRTAIGFRLLDENGAVVRDLDVAHGRRLHLIVVRRDLVGFRHLHPRMDAGGTWRATATLAAAGSYRVFADVTRDGVQQTLGADLAVPGRFDPAVLEPPARVARDDRGLTVRRRPGARGVVAFDVLRGDRVVNDELQDYLGAKGHLVTLRAGDLAYLHTHPESDRLAFAVDLPSAGTYRSWVQFRLGGRVHTAAFTEEVAP